MDEKKNLFKDTVNKVKRFFTETGKKIRDSFVRALIAVKRFFISSRGEGNRWADGQQTKEALAGGTVIFTGAPSGRKTAKRPRPELSEKELRGPGREPTSLFKQRKKGSPFFLQLMVTSSKVMILGLVCVIGIGFGAVMGLANAYLETTPDLDLEQLAQNDLTSNIYTEDGVLLTTYAGMENRYFASLDEIPDLLEKAVIAVEDVRFYHHKGVDFKRLIASFVGNLSGGSSAGGSTITQQLIKNQLLTSERSYKRKIQEAYLALQLEKEYSKEQILEAYLNTIPLGGTNYGVKAAAKDYFGKELGELTLREMACLAGITQYPSIYNPRNAFYVQKDTTRLDARIKHVLDAMYTAGYISLEERNSALEDRFTVIEESSTSKMYSYPHFVEYAISDVIKKFIEYRGLEYNKANRAAIENELRTSGYSIYTTIDTNIQTILEDTLENYSAYPALRNPESATVKQADGSLTIQPQAAAVVMDQHTGYIKGMVGSRYVPTTKLTNNRAVTNRMPVGSTIKPIAVYGPAFDKGYSPASVVDNILIPIEGWDSASGYPTTSKGTLGPVTIRQAVNGSWNNAAARTLMYMTTLDTAAESLINLGVDPESINRDGVGLALGSSGIDPLSLTGAYCAIANGGTYIEPIAFVKVTDRNGNVILTAEDVQERHQGFKKSTAYMLVDVLKTAAENGTGKPARFSGMTVAGKTGSVAYERGALFAGFTPYYTSVVWIGHDNFERLAKDSSGSKTAAPLWKKYMEKIHEGLDDRDILEGSYEDYGLVKETVCSVSGKLATDACRLDKKHPPVKDLFAKGTVPKETCDIHHMETVCRETGMLCSQYCPQESRIDGSVVVLPEDSVYFKLEQNKITEYFPNLMLPDKRVECTLHTYEWSQEQAKLADAMAKANRALDDAETFLESYRDRISEANAKAITDAMSALRTEMRSSTVASEKVYELTSELSDEVSHVKTENFIWW